MIQNDSLTQLMQAHMTLPTQIDSLTQLVQTHLTLSNISIAAAIDFLLAFGSGALMAKKRRSNILGFVLVFVLGPIGIAYVLMAPSKEIPRSRRVDDALGVPRVRPKKIYKQHISVDTIDVQECPTCTLRIPSDADVCRVCQTEIDAKAAVAKLAV
jgi:ribosomal protein L40E